MLVAQAVRAAEQFGDMTIAPEKAEQVRQQIQAQMENLILIGMPGCGKTTVGMALARRLGREFIDADAVIRMRIPMSIPKFFAAKGEAAFREVETDVLRDLGKRSGLVIATGGGRVTRPENYDALHQNGRIIWLKRPLEKLPDHGRPVTQRDGVEKLYKERKHLYEQFADVSVENNSTIEEVVETLCP